MRERGHRIVERAGEGGPIEADLGGEARAGIIVERRCALDEDRPEQPPVDGTTAPRPAAATHARARRRGSKAPSSGSRNGTP